MNKLLHDLNSMQVTVLTQDDFKDGTYRITKPGKYILAEDIVVEPNYTEDWFPQAEQGSYCHRGYHLGFFAAISIESADVLLDLQGHSIEMSPVFSLQQRYFSIIELSNTPFIPGQGPGDFGSLDKSAVRTVICNGILGRSSHHGIHGNYVRNVVLKNLKIHDFEVAGISVNGYENLYLYNVEIGPNRRDVPVNSRYSSARYVHLIGRKWLQQYEEELKRKDAKVYREFKDRLRALEAELNQVLVYIKQGLKVPSNNYFGQKQKIPDGNVYGFLAHVPGVAVNDYIDPTYDGVLSFGLHVHGLYIHDLKTRLFEVVTISEQNGKSCLADVSGSVFRILELVDDPTNLKQAKYKGNLLSHAQIAAAKAGLVIGKPIGRTNLTSEILTWIEQGLPLDYLLSRGYKIVYGGDSLLHVSKGAHGMRLDGLKGGKLRQIKIQNIQNKSAISCYTNSSYSTINSSQKRVGFCGADAVGISFAYTKDVVGKDITIHKIISTYGTARGIRYINGNKEIYLSNLHISNIQGRYKLPYLSAYGIVIEDPNPKLVDSIRFNKVYIEDVIGVKYGWINGNISSI